MGPAGRRGLVGRVRFGERNQNLPAYVVLDDPLGLPINGVENWQPAFLPPMFQGTRFRSTGSPVLNLRPDVEASASGRRDRARSAGPARSRLHQGRPARPAEPRRADRQLRAGGAHASRPRPTPSTCRRRRPQTHEMYGIGREPTDSYGRRCLIARRLVERGVRFVQLYINSQIWDNHTGLAAGMKSGLRPH